MNWFEIYPDRLEAELESLRERGLQFTLDADLRAAGIIKLDVEYPHEDRVIALVVGYPKTFPFLPPDVTAPGESLPRHQHPNGGNLCLIGRRTNQWDNNQTIGELLDDRLGIILDFARTGDLEVLRQDEEPQGEPVSEYIHGGAPGGAYALFDSALKIPDEVSSGRIAGRLRFEKDVRGKPLPHLAIDEIYDRQKNVIAKASVLPLEGWTRINFPWCRVIPPPTGSLEQISQLHNEGAFNLPGYSNLSEKHRNDFFALIYTEEVLQGQFGDAISVFWREWVPKGKSGSERVTPIRTFRAGPSDLAARMPAIRALSSGSVAVFGLGALGAPAAVELAKNGIRRLGLVDFDYVDPATIRRWVVGTSAFGDWKSFALKKFLGREYPWTDYEPVDLKIGAVDLNPENDELEEIIRIINEYDVIIDLTAEVAINQLLSEYCRIYGKPYIFANATPGTWGGLVCQFRPNSDDRCWMCVRQFLYPAWEGLPPADPAGDIQPGGCPARTFTGSSFDLAEIALEVVRTTIGNFSMEGGYPPTTWQLSVCKLREGGQRTVPMWSTHEVPRRQGCTC